MLQGPRGVVMAYGDVSKKSMIIDPFSVAQCGVLRKIFMFIKPEEGRVH